MTEEETVARPPVLVERRALESWGIAEIEAYIDALRAETTRAEAVISGKSRHRGLAEAVFGRATAEPEG